MKTNKKESELLSIGKARCFAGLLRFLAKPRNYIYKNNEY